jgi:hypothetical protein
MKKPAADGFRWLFGHGVVNPKPRAERLSALFAEYSLRGK